MYSLYMLPPPLVCLLCACSDLILSLHRQGQARNRIETRGTSVEIEISKIPPPTKSANTKVTTVKGSQHYPKSTCQSHLSTTARQKPSSSAFNLNLSAAAPPQPSASILRKTRLRFCLLTCLLLLLRFQPQFLSKVRLLFCLQTCLLF